MVVKLRGKSLQREPNGFRERKSGKWRDGRCSGNQRAGLLKQQVNTWASRVNASLGATAGDGNSFRS